MKRMKVVLLSSFFFETRLVKTLKDGLDNTFMKDGTESYTNARGYYNSVKQSTKMNIPGAKSIHYDLSKRFEREKAPAKTEQTVNGTPPDKVE